MGLSSTSVPPARGGGLGLRLAGWLGVAALTALWARERRAAAPEVVMTDARAPGAAPATGDLSKAAPASPQAVAASEPGHGRLADTPAHIPAKGWRDIAWRTFLEVNTDKLPSVAASVTFYSLLAIFPAIGAFVSLYGLFADVGDVSRQLNQLAAFVPSGVMGLLADEMTRIAVQKNSSLSVAFAVSLLLSVWSANAGVNALFDGLNVAYGEKEKRNFFVRRGVTLAFSFAGLVFVTAVTGLLIGAPLLVERFGLTVSPTGLMLFRWGVLLLFAPSAFATVYRFGPSREHARWRWVSVGAVFAAVAWMGGSLAFSWYVNNMGHFDATYGTLSAVVGFMMWIWFTAMVVLTGAELNAEIEHQTAQDSTTGAPMPLGARGAVMADTVGKKFVGFRHLWDSLGRHSAAKQRGGAALPPGQTP